MYVICVCVCVHACHLKEEVQSTNSADTMQITLPGAYHPKPELRNGRRNEIKEREKHRKNPAK